MLGTELGLSARAAIPLYYQVSCPAPTVNLIFFLKKKSREEACLFVCLFLNIVAQADILIFEPSWPLPILLDPIMLIAQNAAKFCVSRDPNLFVVQILVRCVTVVLRWIRWFVVLTNTYPEFGGSIFEANKHISTRIWACGCSRGPWNTLLRTCSFLLIFGL